MRLTDAHQLVVDFESISLRQEDAILFGSLLFGSCECPRRCLRLSFQYQIMLLLFLLLDDDEVAGVLAGIGP